MFMKWNSLLLFYYLSSAVDAQNSAFQNVTITSSNYTGGNTTILVGVAAVEATLTSDIGHSVCGGAIGKALDVLKNYGVINGYNFEFVVEYVECDPAIATGVGVTFMRDLDVDLVIGPACPQCKFIVNKNGVFAAMIMGHLSTYYNKTMVGWGFLTASDFSDQTRFPYLTTVIANSLSLGYSVVALLQNFSWDRVSILYTTNAIGFCDSIVADIETAINDANSYGVTIAYKALLDPTDMVRYNNSLKKAQSVSRIFLLCLDKATDRRLYAVTVSQLNMITDDYVHLAVAMRSLGFGQIRPGKTFLSNGLTPFWEDTITNNTDGLDEVAKNAALSMIFVDLNSDFNNATYYADFQNTVVPRVLGDPLYCQTPACLNNTGKPMGAFARHLHDAFILYGLALNGSTGTQFQDPSTMASNMMISFQGLTGTVTINENGTRSPLYSVYALNSNFQQVTWMNITYLPGQTNISLGYTDPSSTIFATRGGVQPLSRPVCGYSGNDCPKDFWDLYLTYVAVGGALVLLIILGLCCLVVYVLRSRHLEQSRLNAEWQISYLRLQKPPTKKDRSRQSKRSLQSGPSTMTGDSRMTYENEFSNYIVYYLEKEPVLTLKHTVCQLNRDDYSHFVKMRKLDHDNLNKFIGLSIDGANYVSVWKMCARGSMQDIISKGSLSIDPFFIFCIIRDIAEGLNYIHHSFLGYHGALRSSCCLVNESWQVKLTDFGLRSLTEEDKPSKKAQLWTAPEHLAGFPHDGSKNGDIYSFAIIASEIITRKPPWNLQERKESTDELLFLIRKGGSNPLRPDLSLDGIDINMALLHLVRDCWSQKPDDRPPTETIVSLLKSMMTGKKSNLMDHVFYMLEEYTSTLELEVEERTKELSAEKKKADVLLGRMLPKQVADRLKLGQTVEPEGFDSVSVFFSDVVKFTQLAAKCSPFQVVNLLNDLYSNFDSIIEEHGVYKVESIGDGYLCVSGLPVRNGHEHIKEIAEMSLHFMEYVKGFRIPHLPKERLELRIGINSGPCVAGVVGLSMPRYCLFGDTVNTASRMESNGKASHIHMSGDAHDLLVTKYPRMYDTQSRGDVIIKGKGVMETFWLHGRTGNHSESNKREEVKAQRRETLTREETAKGDPDDEGIETDRMEEDLRGENAMYREFRRQETAGMKDDWLNDVN